MAYIRVDFDVLKAVTLDQMRQVNLKPGFKYVQTHMVFGIKMDRKFTHKARLVAVGHKTSPPLSITYSGIATR